MPLEKRICPVPSQVVRESGDMRTAPLILLMDEDERFLEAARLHLEARGYAVAIARTGPEGLALAHQLKPNLVVTEMVLPGCSGFRVLEELKRQPWTAMVVMV